MIEQIRKGDVKCMCSSFERLLMKENARGEKKEEQKEKLKEKSKEKLRIS